MFEIEVVLACSSVAMSGTPLDVADDNGLLNKLLCRTENYSTASFPSTCPQESLAARTWERRHPCLQ
jgi:hypothetical protein